MTQGDISVLGATRFAVGLSAIIEMKPGQRLYATSMKILSGGGTLEIVQCPAALSGSSALGWGVGYPVGGLEVISTVGPAVSYWAATGATMVVGALLGRTNGATTL